MRQILDIALNHLRNSLAERETLIMLFVVPAIMVVFLGAAIGGAPPSGQVIDVIRKADPADDMATNFVNLLRAEGKKQVQGKDRYIICDLANPTDQPKECKLTGSADDLGALAQKRIEAATALAVVSLPAGFSADLRVGKPVTVTINTKAGLTTQQAVQQQIEAVNARLGGSVLAARIVTDKAKGNTEFYDKVYNAAQGIWAKDPVQLEEVSSTVTGTGAGSGFGQSAPGIGSMFVMINALLLAEVFIQERKWGTLPRLMVLPLNRAQILAGKLLGQYLVGVVSFAVMVVVGTAFGVRWGDWAGVIVIILVYTLAVTALGLALSTIVKTAGQAAGIRMLVSLVLAPLGGAWWPLTFVPEWMHTIGQISPIYWSQDAFTKMIFYGATFTDILPSVGVLLLFALVLFAFGVSRFRYE